MKTTNDDCVGIRGNYKRFGRGETYTYIKEQHQVSEQSTKPLLRPAWRQVLISCTVQTASQVYTKYTMLFSLASAQNLHEGPGFLLDLSCLFGTSIDEGAGAFPPFSHSPHLKQDDLGEMIQFLNIRGRRLHLCTIVQVLLSRKLERKAKPIIANPKARIGDEAKKRRQSQKKEMKPKP